MTDGASRNVWLSAVVGFAMAIGACVHQARADDPMMITGISGTVRWIKMDDTGVSFLISRSFATNENPKAPPEPAPTVYFNPLGTKAFDGISSIVHLAYLTGDHGTDPRQH